MLRAEEGFVMKIAEVVPKLLETTIPTRFEPEEIPALKTLLST